MTQRPQTNQLTFLDDAKSWFLSVPIVTRIILSSTISTSIAAAIGIVSPTSLILIPEKVMSFELWRLVTCFFYGQLGFPFLMNLYFLYLNSLQLETGHFARFDTHVIDLKIYNLHT